MVISKMKVVTRTGTALTAAAHGTADERHRRRPGLCHQSPEHHQFPPQRDPVHERDGLLPAQ